MKSFLGNNEFVRGFAVLLIIMGVIQIFNSISYVDDIRSRGTSNGFALFAMFYAPLVGIVMTIGGIFLLMGAN